MIELGTYDTNVDEVARAAYLKVARQLTGAMDSPLPNFGTQLRGEGSWESLRPAAGNEMTVSEVQGFLKGAGFFPFGKVDGICGYRTTAAIRLFQEYVRTIEGRQEFTPDGKWGKASTARARAWQAAGTRADWVAHSATAPSAACAAWIELLGKVKAKYLASPTPMLAAVNAFSKPADTRRVADWDFDPARIHLVGVRLNEGAARSAQRFDDFFVLLINGLAFTFFGSTDPGHTTNPAGYPFLVMGQHRYRFGWHMLGKEQKVFQALKPARHGVLVVRSRDLALTPADEARGVECNGSINVHWGGKGGEVVSSWSEGCQVMVGRGYLNHHDQTVSCAAFAAPNYATLGTTVNGAFQTKGAYTMLNDLVSALSGSQPDDNIVHYTLIYGHDLALHPAIGAARAVDVMARFATLR